MLKMVQRRPSRVPRAPRGPRVPTAFLRTCALERIAARLKHGIVSESGTWKVRINNKSVSFGSRRVGDIAVSSADIIVVYEDGRPDYHYGQVGITVSYDGSNFTQTTVFNLNGHPPIIETI